VSEQPARRPGAYNATGQREQAPDSMAPVVGWDDFQTYVLDWKQDQHVGMIGPTDSGKSTLTYAILPRRKYTTFFGTKIHDKTLDQFAKSGEYERLTDWPPRVGMHPWKRDATADEMPRRLLWPKAQSLDDVKKMTPVFRRAVNDIYAQGGWCVVWDEFWMQTKILDMDEESRILLQQARSNNISFVMGAQRPSRIPLEMFDQTTHLFFWRDNDERNLKTMGGIGWLSAGPIRSFVANLDPYQVLYINTRNGQMWRTTAPEL
jgi:ATP:corrinoid adenosyltransferase